MKTDGMTLASYQNQTQRTLPDLGTEQLNILHMILGMCSELNELYEATDDINRSEEITDIAWYLSNYCNIKKIQLSKIFNFQKGLYYYALKHNNYIEMLQVEISILTDYEKKAFAYKREIAFSDIEMQIIKIAQRLNDCYTAFNINPEVAMERNINKLKGRFPEKFTEEAANNRNLTNERQILEGKEL